MGYLTYFALFVCVALSYDTISARRLLTNDNGRIVGGTEVPIKDYPYMAYLLLYNGSAYFECGGSIISKRCILTAAHCIHGMRSATVRIGSSESMSGGRTYRSLNFKMHPKYDSNSFDYDIGIIKVTTQMDLRNTGARTVPLIRGGTIITPGTKVKISGWGVTSENGSGNGRLMATVVPTLSNSNCQNLLGQSFVSELMFCAGLEKGGRDACQGDSGGPAVEGGIQLGIVSNGFGCARPNTPGIYTNITNPAIRDWLTRYAGI